MPAALVNHEVRKKAKESFFNSTSAEALTTRGVSFNHRKDKKDFEKSKIGGREQLKMKQCAFCRKEGY